MNRPVFTTIDPPVLIADLIRQFEGLSGRALYPAQYERLLISLIAAVTTNTLAAVQDAGEQNLIAYARSQNLDNLGRLLGVTRLEATPALTTVEFAIAPQTVTVSIPKGTRVATQDAVFATTEEKLIAAGQTLVSVSAECTIPGDIGNDRGIGEINNLIDPLPSGIDASVQNITPSRGGAEVETDKNLRKRLLLAPESFSNAGSAGAYRFHALSASQYIIDVGVRGASLLAPTVDPPASFKTDLQAIANGESDGIDLVEEAIALLNQTPFVMPGTVEIFPLASDGLPSLELKALIESKLNEDKIRPLTDWVKILDPVEVSFEIEVAIAPEVTADRAAAKVRAEQTLQALTAELRRGLGRSVLVSEIVRSVKALPEIYDVSVVSPTQNLAIEAWEWTNCSGIVVELSTR